MDRAHRRSSARPQVRAGLSGQKCGTAGRRGGRGHGPCWKCAGSGHPSPSGRRSALTHAPSGAQLRGRPCSRCRPHRRGRMRCRRPADAGVVVAAARAWRLHVGAAVSSRGAVSSSGPVPSGDTVSAEWSGANDAASGSFGASDPQPLPKEGCAPDSEAVAPHHRSKTVESLTHRWIRLGETGQKGGGRIPSDTINGPKCVKSRSGTWSSTMIMNREKRGGAWRSRWTAPRSPAPGGASWPPRFWR